MKITWNRFKEDSSLLLISFLLVLAVFAVSQYSMYSSEKDQKELLYYKVQAEALTRQIENLEASETYKLAEKLTPFVQSEQAFDKAMKITNDTPLDLVSSVILVDYSHRLNVPVSMMLAVIEKESKFEQYAVGRDQDRGYCQVIPKTEEWIAKKLGETLSITYNPTEIFEPEYNLALGGLYIRHLLDKYGKNYHRALSEYNRGYSRLEKYRTENGTYATDYSYSVLAKADKYKHYD